MVFLSDPILLAHDGSEIAAYAAEDAARLASALDRPLHIVHAADSDAFEERFARLGRDIQALPEALVERGEELVDEAAGRARKHGLDVETAVRQGPPAETIVDHADRIRAAMLVLGTHHQGDLQHAVLGSVADRVVRTAEVPVMTVRSAPRRGPGDPYERLLVPTDGSRETELAADEALGLASATGAALTFVHVVAPEIEEGPYWAEDRSMEETIDELAREALDPLARQAEDAGVRYETVRARGRVHDAILDQADASDADAIVISTHGWGSADRFWLGSVTDKVLRTAPVPVVTVPAGAGL